MKSAISILVLVSACGAQVEGMAGGDDTVAGDDDGQNPDDDGTVSAPGLKFLTTTVRDERGDAIDFSSGEPVHTHGGPFVKLGGPGCPDVHKFDYLMDARTWGKEDVPNPITWNIEVTGGKLAEYRLRGESFTGEWSALPALKNSVATITIPRDAIPPHDLDHVHLSIDVRLDDGTSITGCWTHHSLAAPVEIQQARTEPAGLFAMSLLADSPISTLIAGTNVPVFSQRFVHHTEEAVTMTIDVAPPSATYQKRIVDDYVVARTGLSGVLCADDSGFESTDPICSQTPPGDPADETAQGPLAYGGWTLTILDEATNQPASACTVAGFRATCQLPARTITEAAKAFRAVLSIHDVADLATSTTGPYAEYTIAGKTFTGAKLDSVQRCQQFQSITKQGFTITTCRTFVEYQRIRALDAASIAFANVPFTITTAGVLPAYVPSPLTATGALTWDAGDDDLPGPQ